jgi:ABC-type glycerol-3-phosphate transport system substrate-binding protein
MARSGVRLISRTAATVAVSVLALGACNSSNPTVTLPPLTTAPPTPTAAATTSGPVSGITIRWFVGLDPHGTTPAQVDAEKAFVASYNKMNGDGITIKLEVEPATTAADVLKTEMANGNTPDIIGPVGFQSRIGFDGFFLDLTSEIERANVDMSAYDPAVVKFLKSDDGSQIGLPYTIAPGYIWYNRDAFAKAGLPDLPTKVGDQYQGQAWDWKALAKVAAQLTLDKGGKKSGDSGFDAKNIVQYGFDCQGCDARQLAAFFGGNWLVASDGKTSQITPLWNDAMNWYYSALWTSHIAPIASVVASTQLAEGNSQSSGAVAMNAAWIDSVGSIATDSKTSKVKRWDIGVVPAWNGTTSSPMTADTFAITRASKNPGAAFKAMLAIMADASLQKVYGREPAKKADRPAYFDAVDATLSPLFPGNQVTWSVLDEMATVPATPSPDSALPAFDQAGVDIDAFYSKLQTTSGLDVKAEVTKLQVALQKDYDAVQPIVNQ